MAQDHHQENQQHLEEVTPETYYSPGGSQTLSLLQMPVAAFEERYRTLVELSEKGHHGKLNHIQSALMTLQSLAGTPPQDDDLASNRQVRNKLSHTVAVLYRMFGKPHVLDLLATIFHDAMLDAVARQNVDDQGELEKLAGFMLEQLQHEVEKNVITREQFYREILVGNLLHRPYSGVDILPLLIGSELETLYRDEILYHFYMEKAVNKDSAHRTLVERVDAEIIPRLALDEVDKKYPLSVFEFLQEVVELGPVNLQNLPEKPETLTFQEEESFLHGVIEENTERLYNDKVMKLYLEDIRRLVMTALEHRKGTGQEKNVLVLFSVADIFLKKIMDATEEQKKAYPDMYVHLDYVESRDRSTFGNVKVDLDAWKSNGEDLKAPDTHQTLLKEIHAEELQEHEEQRRRGETNSEYSLRYQDIFMRYLLRSVVSTFVREHYDLSRVMLPSQASKFLLR